MSVENGTRYEYALEAFAFAATAEFEDAKNGLRAYMTKLEEENERLMTSREGLKAEVMDLRKKLEAALHALMALSQDAVEVVRATNEGKDA